MNDTITPVQSDRERELEEKLASRALIIALLGLAALMELIIIVQLTMK